MSWIRLQTCECAVREGEWVQASGIGMPHANTQERGVESESGRGVWEVAKAALKLVPTTHPPPYVSHPLGAPREQRENAHSAKH